MDRDELNKLNAKLDVLLAYMKAIAHALEAEADEQQPERTLDGGETGARPREPGQPL